MKVEELRKLTGMNPQDFANEIGATVQSIYRWEKANKEIDDNKIMRPFRSQMVKMAKKAEKNHTMQ